jgi:V4R domain
MISIPTNTPPGGPDDPIAKARDHVLVIIDTDEVRSQRLASLLTLTGVRAMVTTSTYQAFDRCLKERCVPEAILVGQNEEIASALFSRFSLYLKQELKYDVPVLRIGNIHLVDGNLLVADERASTHIHQVSPLNRDLLKKIWQVVPSARISLKHTESAYVLNSLPKLGLHPRVTHLNRSTGQHFWEQISAAKRIIPANQWETLLTDVGLAQFCQEEHWPDKNEQQHTVPSEYFSLLTRAVLLSNPAQPAKQVYDWTMLVGAEVLKKPVLISIIQQASKFLGQERIIRILFNEILRQSRIARGEDLAGYKRLDDGSYLLAVYSNIHIYGFMGAARPSCYVWIAAINKGLEVSNLQKRWKVREIECSGVSHTGHCVFHLTPEAS